MLTRSYVLISMFSHNEHKTEHKAAHKISALNND